MTKLARLTNKRIWQMILILFIFVLGMLVGSYHSDKNLEKIANENIRLSKELRGE